MNSTTGAGVALTAGGLLGYAVGVVAAYPGRAFSVSGVMVGLTLVAVGAGGDGSDGRTERTDTDATADTDPPTETATGGADR